MYEVIEAADTKGWRANDRGQWWVLGLMRSKAWAASEQWEQMSTTPFVGGPMGDEPHGCSVQYNTLWTDPSTAKTFFACWDVSFHPADKSTPRSTRHMHMYMYELQWGAPILPMKWLGPTPDTQPNPTINSTVDGLLASSQAQQGCRQLRLWIRCLTRSSLSAEQSCSRLGLHENRYCGAAGLDEATCIAEADYGATRHHRSRHRNRRAAAPRLNVERHMCIYDLVMEQRGRRHGLLVIGLGA